MKRSHLLCTTVLVLSQFWCPSLWARETNAGQAKKVVRGWLTTDAKPLGAELGQKIDKVDSFTDYAGNIVYYVVYLQPSGFVIVSADDLVEPIIGFVSKGSYDPSISNPLGALVSGDLPHRIAAARSLAASAKADRQKSNSSNNRAALRKDSLKAQDKWAKYSNYEIGTVSTLSISDVWVEPLTQSTWGQGNVGDYVPGTTCYNYYTPSNWPCGCTATAMAQLIRYHQHQPVGGVGWPYLGGDGSGGPYVWPDMPLQPAVSTITLAQRQAIGALCYDAAESIGTSYGSGGSSASLHDADQQLLDTFDYSNSIYYYNYLSDIPVGSRTVMINPNLDAGYPVFLGLSGSVGGHVVVCDGYGYNASTLYHHLNMGWSGNDNAWYNLPNVDASFDFDTVDTCVYNVFTSGSDEIISGRVTDLGGRPISDVNVTATGGGTYSTTTNSRGVYALANVPSNTSFTLAASKGNWSFSGASTSTGQSTDHSGTPGNKWGVNFTGTISAGVVEFDKDVYLPPETITITLVDSDLVGSGTVSVLVTTSGGDEETVSLSENPSSSGVFTASVSTALAAVVTEDGTIQLGLGETITVTYEDADDGTGNPATAQDTATVPACIDTEGFETGDFSSFPWTHFGDANWVITSAEQNSGTYSAKAGAITHNEGSALEVTLDCIAGDITFYRKVSSESGYDFLDFYIDGALQDDWSGEIAWSQVSYPVSVGTRTFSWLYSKDFSVSNGSDTAWIDDIEFPIECETEKYGGGSGTAEDPYLIYTAEQMQQIGADSNDWDKHFKLMADIDLSSYTGTQFNMIGNFFPPPAVPFSGTFNGNGHIIYNFTYKTSEEEYGIGLFGHVSGEDGVEAEIKNVTLVDPNVDAGPGGDAGPIVGFWFRVGTLSDCAVIGGSVKGIGGVGGLLGSNMYGNIIRCSSSADVTATTTELGPAGGLIGINNFGAVSLCYSAGNVTSNNVAGGLIGATSSGSSTTNCYSMATVTGPDYVGGLVGYNGSPITNCYSVGSVSGPGVYVSGLIGANTGGAITASFWDVNTSGQSGPWAGTDLTTVEMQTESTFTDAGWDFVDEIVNGPNDIWTIWDGRFYPRLTWENPISGDFGLDNLWMYQNLPGKTDSNLTATVSITDDPLGNSSYSYEWEFILPNDVNVAPATAAGGGAGDAFWTFAAPGCDEPNGISDLGQAFTVKVTVTGNDYGNTGTAEAQFGIALLGDVNNSGSINATDRSIINAFWKLPPGSVAFTLRDCDLNCSGAVNSSDRSIVNGVWRGMLGQNSVTNPCPFR